MKLLISVLAMLPTMAAAQNKQAASAPVAVTLIVKDGLLKIERGGCLMGPATFVLGSGKEQFRIPDGEDFPKGCSKIPGW